MSTWGKPLLVAAPSGTVSGNPIEFTGNGDYTSYTISFSPEQSGSGTPSLDNIRKITSRSSINIYQFDKNIYDADLYPFETGGINAGTGNNSLDSTSKRIRTIGYIPAESNTSYKIKSNMEDYLSGSAFTYYVFCYNSSYTFIGSRLSATKSSNYSFVTETNTAYIRMYIYPGSPFISGTDTLLPPDLTYLRIVRYKNTPSTNPAATKSFNNNTVAGGIVDDVKLIRTYYFIEFDGTESWSQTGTAGTTRLFRYTLSNAATSSSSGVAYTRSCSHFANENITSSTQTQGFYAYTSSGTTTIRLQFRPNLATIADSTAWKQFLADQKAAGTPVQVYFQDPLQTVINFSGVQAEQINNGYNYIETNYGTQQLIYPKNRLFYLS